VPDINRRSLMSMAGISILAAALAPRAAAVPPATGQPGLATLTADSLAADAIIDRLGLAGRVQVRHLGTSRDGRPIPLLSVGEGQKSALIVGAPHPNEPTGCLTVLAMLARLGREPNFQQTPGWQWHFIPAIDIDGIALNEGWFSDDPDIASYLAHFYRPPFRLQPEYSFPIDTPSYRFSAETPESACWRRALEITRPRLQCSLHGADTDGSFFLLSGNDPQLADELVRLPAGFGVSLNEVGEPLSELTTFRPGVFAFPSVADTIAQAVSAGAAPQTTWAAGDSSSGFAGRQFGTFSMTCEVPLWRDARENDQTPSGRTLGQVIDERISQVRQESDAVARWLPTLEPLITSFAARALTEALADSRAAAAGTAAALEQLRSTATEDRELRQCDLVGLEYGTAGMRVPAMLLRLATLTGDGAATSAARAVLDIRLNAFRSATRLSAIPAAVTTDLQIAAVLATAARLGAEG
jgi:hypothetical protein